jgi:hypothetical protein
VYLSGCIDVGVVVAEGACRPLGGSRRGHWLEEQEVCLDKVQPGGLRYQYRRTGIERAHGGGTTKGARKQGVGLAAVQGYLHSPQLSVMAGSALNQASRQAWHAAPGSTLGLAEPLQETGGQRRACQRPHTCTAPCPLPPLPCLHHRLRQVHMLGRVLSRTELGAGRSRARRQPCPRCRLQAHTGNDTHTHWQAPGYRGCARNVDSSGERASSTERCSIRVNPTILCPPGRRRARRKLPYSARVCSTARLGSCEGGEPQAAISGPFAPAPSCTPPTPCMGLAQVLQHAVRRIWPPDSALGSCGFRT